MVHEHKIKKVNIRKFQRNIYANLPKDEDETVVVTNRDKAVYFVSSLSASDSPSVSATSDESLKEIADRFKEVKNQSFKGGKHDHTS